MMDTRLLCICILAIPLCLISIGTLKLHAPCKKYKYPVFKKILTTDSQEAQAVLKLGHLPKRFQNSFI